MFQAPVTLRGNLDFVITAIFCCGTTIRYPDTIRQLAVIHKHQNQIFFSFLFFHCKQVRKPGMFPWVITSGLKPRRCSLLTCHNNIFNYAAATVSVRERRNERAPRAPPEAAAIALNTNMAKLSQPATETPVAAAWPT